MNDLIELSNVVSKIKSRSIDIIGQGDKNSLSYKLYDGICSNKINTDADAREMLYGENSNHNTLTKLKSRLKNKLFNTVFFIDSNRSQINDIRSAYTYTHKQYALVKLLVQFGARKTAMNLAEKIYKISTKYHITEIQLLTAQTLKYYYAYYSINQKKYQFYLTKFDELRVILDAEVYVLDCIFTQNLLKLKSKTSKVEIEKHFDSNIDKLNAIKAQVSSFNFQRSYFNFLVRFAEVQSNKFSLTEVCQEAINYFNTIPFATPAIYFTFHLRILKNCIIEKDSEQATNIFEEYKDKFQNLIENRFSLYYDYSILNLHTKEYNLAFQTFYTARTDSQFKKLSASDNQSFILVEAYIHFLLNIGKINPSKTNINTSQIKIFRINKFLNDIPSHSKLKTGSNIAVLIIHVLFLLQMKKHDAIIDRVEALNQYCYRYLKNDETLRYNCFIKMLIQMTKADFNRIRTIRYSEKLIKRLATAPLDQSGISLETEIIPFEDLWEMVLDLLD